MKKILIISFLFLMLSCFKIETKDANESYKYWTGKDAPKEIKLIKGEYYQSPYFTLEYELFLKFESDKNWFYEFVKYNKLENLKGLDDLSTLKNAPNLREFIYVLAENQEPENILPALENSKLESVFCKFGSDKKNNQFDKDSCTTK
jgi:hypothetical protein